ncbi:endo-1,4-beta-xylanase [Haloferula helveola]
MNRLLIQTIACVAWAMTTTAVPASEAPGLHPAVTAFFESEDPFVQKVVIPNIEANRKCDAVLSVVDSEGKPIDGATVSASLARHEFLFGHCDLATEQDPKQRKLLNELFHYTCPGNVTKWRAHAKTPDRQDFSKIDEVLGFCDSRGVDFEWHFLSGYHPGWLEEVDSVSEKARHQVENSKAVLQRYGDRVRFFQVINEDWRTHIDRAKVYIDQTAWFAELRKEFPDVELGVCDCWSFNTERQLPGVEELKARYPGINFISMHAHNPRQLWASPKEMYGTYDPYLNSGIKIHLTEFGIILGEITGEYRSGEWTDELLAEYFVQALATSFSHKSVRTFNFWSNYEKFTGNPLFTEEGEPNVKYRAIQSLLQDKLTTRESGATDASGRFAFRGFHGEYDLVVTLGSGTRITGKATLASDASEVRLVMDPVGRTLTPELLSQAR